MRKLSGVRVQVFEIEIGCVGLKVPAECFFYRFGIVSEIQTAESRDPVVKLAAQFVHNRSALAVNEFEISAGEFQKSAKARIDVPRIRCIMG